MTITIDGKPHRMVPAQATDAMVDVVVSTHLSAEVRRPVHDVEREAVEAAIAAAPPEADEAVVELVRALERAERKLAAYVGVCPGDKELTGAVLPMARAVLARFKVETDDA